MAFTENTLFDNRYFLVKRLGQGASAQVWLAQDRAVNNLRVALKILSERSGMDTYGVQNFQQEFTSVFNLHHQNILKPTGYSICDGVPYLVLPYCENGSAENMVGRCDESDIIKILHDVAAGLEYLHSQGFVHQDIKPDNILVDDDCNFLVTDFGISTRASGIGHGTSGRSGGTREYMGPERCVSGAMAEPEGDIWALGASIFELLTGYPPFGEHGGLLQASGEPLPQMPDNLQPEVAQMITACLDADPQQRPTAEQLRKKTERYMETGSWKDTAGKKYLYISLAAAAAVILLVGLFVFDHYRTKVFYYKDYVERWGVPEGVGRLSRSEARHMHRMYRFESRKGVVVEVAHVNSLGKIIRDDESERNERPLCQQITYNSDGKVNTITVMDHNRKPLYLKSFNESLTKIIFQFPDKFNTDRRLSARSVGYGRLLENDFDEQKGLISRWHITYDEKTGLATKIEYAGSDDSPVGDVNNIYGRTMAYDDKGRITEIRYIGKDGAPKSTKWGLGIKRFTYDADDNWVKAVYLTVDETPAFDDSDGVSIFEMKYDEYGNVVEAIQKDGDGNLMLPKKNNIAGVRFNYDEHGFITSYVCLGIDGEPAFVPGQGSAGFTAKCDDNGFFCEQQFVDTQGQPCNTKNGFSKIVSDCDERGNELERWYYNVSGELCLSDEGIAGYKQELDSVGNFIEIVFYGTDRKPVASSGGCAGWRCEYDERNMLVKQTYLDTSLQPAYNNMHIAVAKYEYKQGNLVRRAFYAPDGETLEESSEQIAGWNMEYDDLGNEVKRSFFNKNGNPCNCNQGYAEKRAKYDGSGNMLQTRYYGLNGNLVMVNGEAGADYEYDQRGNALKHRPVGTDGRQAPGKLTVVRKYDEKDNCIDERVYNNDRPATDKDGVHRYTFAYNHQNLMTERHSFGTGGNPVIDKSLGVSVVKFEYDNKGNRVKSFNYNTDGKPMKGAEGWASSTFEYNNMGMTVKQCFFGTDGKPSNPSDIVPVGICDYDKWGNMIYLASQDDRGQFIMNKNTGCAIQRMEYNDRSQRTQITCYDQNDKPCNGAGGYHKCVWTYDNNGNVTQDAIYTTAGKPTDGKRSFFKCVTTYAKDGVADQQKYYKANNQLLATRRYVRSRGAWGDYNFVAEANTGTLNGGYWQETVREMNKELPKRIADGVVMQSVSSTSSLFVMTFRFTNISESDSDIDEKVDGFKGLLGQLKQQFRKIIGIPNDVDMQVVFTDKSGNVLLRQ